jgi:hypothetical protein
MYHDVLRQLLPAHSRVWALTTSEQPRAASDGAADSLRHRSTTHDRHRAACPQGTIGHGTQPATVGYAGRAGCCMLREAPPATRPNWDRGPHGPRRLRAGSCMGGPRERRPTQCCTSQYRLRGPQSGTVPLWAVERARVAADSEQVIRTTVCSGGWILSIIVPQVTVSDVSAFFPKLERTGPSVGGRPHSTARALPGGRVRGGHRRLRVMT